MLSGQGANRSAIRRIGERFSNLVGALLVILMVVPCLLAVQPELRELQPPGAQRGKTFSLTLKGEALESGAEVITTLPATISRLAPPKDLQTPDSELLFLVQLPDDAPVGLYPIRVHTENGLSNVLIFSVGDLPEAFEKEPNNSIDQAQPITVPVTVNGSLAAADQDFYRLSVQARERLVIEVEARRLASAIDPVIEVLDPSGRRIAFNDDAPGLGVDARVDVIFPKAGNYYVLVHDSKYSNQERKFYRLKVGSYAYAEGIFPLGGQRGKIAEISLFGGNLEKPIKVHARLDVPPNQHTIPVNLPGPKPVGSLPFQFQVGDFPEVLAPEEGSVAELQPATVVNGRIAKPGQVGRFKLKVSPGQQWLLELDAASLGTSRLYGSLAVLDQQGKELPVEDVAEGPDPKLAFKVPDKAQEVTLAVRDLRGLGGPAFGYRLLALPQASDFSLKVLTPYVNIPAGGVAAIEVLAERNGYDGPIQLSILDLPEDLVAEGGHIAAIAVNYAGARPRKSHGYLTVEAKADARSRKLALSVWGEGGSANNPIRPIRRRAEGLGLAFTINEEPVLSLTGDPLAQKPVTAEWLGMELPAAVTRPVPVTLETSTPSFRLPVGMGHLIEWKLLRQGPGIEPVRINATLEYGEVRGLELEGAGGGKADIAGKDSGTLVLRSQPDTPLVKFDMVVSSTVKINGKEETVLAPAVTVDLVRGYSIALAQDRAELKGGGKIELAGTVQREPTFATAVNIKVADPPDKVTCGPIEVPEGQSAFRLVCEAAPDVLAGDFEVHLLSSAVIPGRNDKREYNFPALAAHLVVAGGKPSQTVARRQ